MIVRQVVLVAHRWLGLTTALFLSILGATGAVLVWPGEYPLRRIANRLHTRLAMGQVGHWIVIASTAVALLVLLCGLFLWWQQKIVSVRTGAGWRPKVFDLHHSVGVAGFLLMFMLAVSGFAMLRPPSEGGLLRLLVNLHTARGYGSLVRLLYTLGTAAFIVQAVTGLGMWWKPKGRR